MSFRDKVLRTYRAIEEKGLRPVWISLVPPEQALERAAASKGSLEGLTFAVKDNMDFAGLPTTAACPAYSYTPETTAPVVRLLQEAGAVAIGKTNMDQFATGLTGTRTPYGACSSVFDERYVSGGSSSGSAVAVASGLVDFALGSDTAGSGRVPAAFNGIVGWKPTRRLLSTQGVVPACRSLDCVSTLTRTVGEAIQLWKLFAPGKQRASPWLGGAFRFGVPRADQLEFFGDLEAAALFKKAQSRMADLGGERVEIDFAPFRAAADLLYGGPWVAERLASIQGFFEAHQDEMDPIVRRIIGGSARFTAVDAYRGAYRLAELREECDKAWSEIDVMFLPTAGTIYTHEQIRKDPIGLNTNLGYYTNFANLLDLAAVACPAGRRPNRLPFGISLIGQAGTDAALLQLAAQFGGEAVPLLREPPGSVLCAVVGAHLTGQPLNWQLTKRRSRLAATTRTAPGYRLYALSGTVPAKPGLVRDPSVGGPGIEVEVWAVPEEEFGSFVAGVPAPLGIGSAELADGSTVKCFICEPYAIGSAGEITHLGGWRAYMEVKG